MEDPQMPGGVPPTGSYQSGGYQQVPPPGTYPPPNGYTQTPYPPPPGSTVGTDGLTDTAAGALAYITIIPAIIFLIMEPYNRRPFVKFHCFQCLGLGVVWFCLGIVGIVPILGWMVLLLGSLALLICWIMSIVKASQGSYFKVPGISEFAAKQSGYPI